MPFSLPLRALPRFLVGALVLGASFATLPTLAPAQDASYQLTRHVLLGGEGGWDYVTVDTVGNRLFLTRSDRVMVVDPVAGKVVGEIPGMERAHGVAMAYPAGHGFVSSGRDSSVTMFDLESLQVLGKTTVGAGDDAILYDPTSQRVFTFNGGDQSSSVLDPVTGHRLATIPLGGRPEFAVSAGNGKLYVNIENTSEVAEIDATAMKVTRRWSIAPGEEPSGLALDTAHGRLFSVCRNQLMVVSDVAAGSVVTTVPIGRGVDGAGFDPGTGDAFASNGEGTLTVVHRDAPDRYHVAQTVTTMRGARTMGVDPRTHCVYTESARFQSPPEGAEAGSRHRWTLVPDSFELLVIERRP